MIYICNQFNIHKKLKFAIEWLFFLLYKQKEVFYFLSKKIKTFIKKFTYKYGNLILSFK